MKGTFEVICCECGEILIESKDPKFVSSNGRIKSTIFVTCRNCKPETEGEANHENQS